MKTNEKIESLKSAFIKIMGKEGEEARFWRAGLEELIRAVVIEAKPTHREIRDNTPSLIPRDESDYQRGRAIGWIDGACWFEKQLMEYLDADFDRGNSEQD